jgi:hypothetical protein
MRASTTHASKFDPTAAASVGPDMSMASMFQHVSRVGIVVIERGIDSHSSSRPFGKIQRIISLVGEGIALGKYAVLDRSGYREL